MATTVIDTLITRFLYQTDRASARAAEKDATRVMGRIRQQAGVVARGIGQVGVALGAVGVAAFAVGAPAERAFTRLRTQLGLTAEEADDARARIEGIAEGTGRGLDELANAYFTLRSNGLEAEQAMEFVRQAAMGAAIELGDAADIANVAGSAFNALGETQPVEILLGAIQAGNIPNAGALASSLGPLLSIAGQLGIGFDEVNAAIAGYTRTGVPVSEAANAVRGAMNALLKPSEQAQQIFRDLDLTTQDVHQMIREGGLLQTLRDLQEATGYTGPTFTTEEMQVLIDTHGFDEAMAIIGESAEMEGTNEAFTRLIGRVEALGFALHATGRNAQDYADILDNIEGDVDVAFGIVQDAGFHQATTATNEFKLALDALYNDVIVPILRAFNRLPDVLRNVLGGAVVAQLAGHILGMGNLFKGLWRIISGGAKIARLAFPAILVAGKLLMSGLVIAAKAVAAGIAALVGTVSLPVLAIIAAVAAAGAAMWFFRDQIRAAWQVVRDQASRTAQAIDRQFGHLTGPVVVFIGAMAGLLGDLYTTAGSIIAGFQDEILHFIQWLRSMWVWLWESLRVAVLHFWNWFRGVPGLISGLLRQWMATLLRFLHGRALTAAFLAVGKAVATGLAGLIAAVGAPIIAGVTAALAAAAALIWIFRDEIRAAWAALRDGLADIRVRVAAWWDDTVVAGIRSAWAALRDGLADIRVRVAAWWDDTVVAGIRSAWAALRDGLADIRVRVAAWWDDTVVAGIRAARDGLVGAVQGAADYYWQYQAPEGVPFAPAVAGPTPAAAPTVQNRNTTVNLDRIDIRVAQGDPEVIGGQIGDVLREQLHDAVEDFDSTVAR